MSRTAHRPRGVRRALTVLVALGVVTGGLLGVPEAAPVPAAAAVKRPNIVMVMMDDMRWDELRFAPHVQRHVTGRGVRFTNAFSGYPLCCPARASFLTGRYAHNHGVLHVKEPFGFGSFDDRRTIAGQLQRAGYRTAMAGKYLNGYGRMPSRVTGGPSYRYKPAGWTDWMASIEKKWPRGSKFRGGTYNYLAFTQNVNGRTVANKGRYSSDVIGQEAVGLVGKYAGPSPFFLLLNPVAPHHGAPFEKGRDPRDYRKANGVVQQFPTPYTPRWVRGRFDKVVTHAPGVPLRRAAEPDVSDKMPWYRTLLENTPTEKSRLRTVERQRAESIYAWDRQFGRIVAKLQATGEYADTVFVFTSDNGYYLGEHRHPAGKVEPHDVSIRVPLVVAGPGIARGVRHAPAQLHDVTATLLDLAGAAPLPGMDGASLRGVLTGADDAWTHPVLTESIMRVTGPRVAGFPAYFGQVGLRTGRWKYIRYAGGQEELYDLARDPNELTGRQRDPAYAPVKAALLAEWQRYARCRGAACTAPLSPDLQVDAATLAAYDAHARRQWDAYYN